MIIQIDKNCTVNQLVDINAALENIGFKGTKINTQFGQYIIAIGKREFDIRKIGRMQGIVDIHRVSDDFKLVSSKWKVGKTKIKIGTDNWVGDGHFQIMAGPCSIESEAQIDSTIAHLLANNVTIMRGGVYKPRSSPYSFRGLGQEGLKIFYKKCKEHNIKIITEVMQVSQIEPMHDYVDIFQVGARNSQNFNLLDELGKVDKPVLLKRGISGTIEELLQAAEYIFSNGNEKIMLCERGIRTFEGAYRNTMDLNAISILKEKTHLPVIADPSHGIGIRRFVPQIALASILAGADGLIVEVHENPEKAFSDGQQTLSYKEAEALYKNINATLELRKNLL